ncbi:MAG: methyltransferase domain-containing protein [Nanoarchaeota archaeon]
MAQKDSPPWQYYDDSASGYDQLHGEEQRRKTQAIISIVKPEPDWKVIDIGCGTGVSMEGWPCKIRGIEPSQEMAASACGKGLDVTIAPAESLPFPDNSFDLAIAVTSAHHFKPGAFKEMARVAKLAAITLLAKSDIGRIRRDVEKHWTIRLESDCHPDVIWICDRR